MDIGTVRPVNINEEMRGSYLDYAMSVIVARALPDARDGLKPVHRRILYAMHDMGLGPGVKYRKSARIVGDVLGKYHPHGDQAVYDAMARMAQDFSMRYLLIDGQGNFGSIDGDSPAAMRYTEARMGRIAAEMLEDINMDTVDFVDNFDGTVLEPSVLPSKLPNMLLNGASGIAVGMATNIPPHNLRELVSAIVHMIDHYDNVEDVSVDELMEFLPGPDFPTGAMLIGGEELKQAYATGKGRIIMRAAAAIEEMRNGRFRIVVTEIPYQINKTTLIERIAELARAGRLDMITDLRDESDRNGLRIVMELRRNAQPKKVLNRLYKWTALQSTFGVQMLALVDNEPRLISLKRALQIYIEHRRDVIRRRSEFELDRMRARAHILEGLLKALATLDDIIETIRRADDADEALTALMTRFSLSEAQSRAILDMQLRRLAALERQKIEDEYKQVRDRIEYLENLLRSPALVLELIKTDLLDLAEKFGDNRRTRIVHGIGTDFNEADLIPDEEVLVSFTRQGYIKRVPAEAYRRQMRGGKGASGMATREEDIVEQMFSAGSLDHILFFTDRGKVYSERAYEIPDAARAARGILVQAILSLEPGERVTAMAAVPGFEEDGYFVLCTRHGRIKRVRLQDFATVRSNGLIAMSLARNDELGWVRMSNGDQDVVIVTENGMSIRFHEDDVRVMGRPASGVNAIRLRDDDVVVGMDVIEEQDSDVLIVTQNAFGKRSSVDEYNQQGRYGLGVRTLSRNERTGPIVAARAINAEDDITLITTSGMTLRTSLESVRQTGRSTQGVQLMNLKADDSVISIAIVEKRRLMERQENALELEEGDRNIEPAVDVDDYDEEDAGIDSSGEE
jgi:DNA gyrase subunit A